MPTLALPTVLTRPSSIEWRLDSNTQQFTSPLSGATQTLALPGQRWSFTFTYPYISRANADAVSVFTAQLRGMAGRFKTGNPARSTPLGTATGTPVVAGASQLGISLATSGWTASTLVLKAGDFIEVNGELKLITADVTSGGTGLATLAFEPPMRAAPANLAPIVTASPGATFRLKEDSQALRFDSYYERAFTLEGVEVFV